MSASTWKIAGKDKKKKIDFMKNITIAFLNLTVFMVLAGCYTPEKALQQADKAMNKYPDKVLPLFRGQFPCITTAIETKSDSAAFKAWQDSVQQVRSFYEELLSNVVPEVIHDTTIAVDSDICNDMLVKYRANDKKHIEKESILAKQVADLNNKLKSIPPVNNNTVKTVEDSSKIKLLMIQIGDKDYLIRSLQEKNDAKDKWILWLIIACLLLAGVNVLQFKKII